MKIIAKNHPLRKAQWIWPVRDGQRENTYAQFRRDFTLEFPQVSVPFYVTADQAYQLWVNGQYVGRGPARGYQETWPSDKYNIAPYLKAGKNWISILAHNPGRSTFQYVQQGAAGMICAGKAGGVNLASGKGWQMRPDPAREKNTATMSVQLSYQESFDATLDNESWIARTVRPRGNGWVDGATCNPAAYGHMPWHELTEREIPHLTTDVMPYETLTSIGQAPADDAWADESNITLPGWREFQEITPLARLPKATRHADHLSFRVKPAPAESVSVIVVDLSKVQVGTPRIEVLGATGGEVLDVHYTEKLEEDGRPFLDNPMAGCHLAMASRLRLAKGKTTHELFPIIGHRYAAIIVRNAAKPLTFRLGLRKTVYPLSIRGRFNSSDRLLNDIYALCRHTQEICMLDAYVDTPWREQAQWWGDARVQGLNTFFLSGDTQLLRRGIEQIGQQRVPNGLTYGHAPTVSHNCILPDFTLIWMLTFWDDYRQTGDLDLLGEHRTSIEKALAYFTGEGVGVGGLLRSDPRYWLFLDWCDIYKGEIPAVLNLWYLIALQKLTAMAEQAGLDAWAGELKHLRNRQERLIVQKLWDPKERMFCDGLDAKGKPVKTYSIHTQTLAMMAGLKKRLWWRMIDERLLPYLREEKVASPQPSSYWVHYVYDVMSRAAYGAEVLEHIARNWEPMLPYGSCWETFGSGGTDTGGSISHAWAAHPLVHISRILGGVWQTGPGWESIEFRPIFAGRTRAKLSVPTPFGLIRANWIRESDGRYRVNLILPDLMTAGVTLPGVKETGITGSHTWTVDV